MVADSEVNSSITYDNARIRMALGATPSLVIRNVLGRTLRLALTGMVAGVAVSILLARLIATLLFGTAPTDPTIALRNN
jgi:ABC-type antimicrobial peptide transport system permease subunit